MFDWIRAKFGPIVIAGVVAMIGFVFVASDIFDIRGRRFGGGGASAGSVNGDQIPAADFTRALNQRMEMFRNLGGGKFTDEQLKAFRIKEGVFNDLVNRKLVAQDASRRGLSPGPEEVRHLIREIPAFQKDGKFDLNTYKSVLAANNYTPGGFEERVREDATVQHWNEYLSRRVQVSEQELKDYYLTSQDKRNIKYVLLTTESGRKGIQVEKSDIDKFFADQSKANLAKSRFDSFKDTQYKGKTFEQSKEAIARDILQGEKMGEVQKINEQLAGQVLATLTADKSSDAKVNALLKPYGVEVKSTGLVSQQNSYLPGIGEAKDLMKDAFAEKSPIVPGQGGKAKKYSSGAWTMVAIVTDVQKPDLSKLESEREKLLRQLTMNKERDMQDAIMKQLREKARIKPNPTFVGDNSGEG